MLPQYLYLNQIGADGAGRLAEVLPQCRTLSCLLHTIRLEPREQRALPLCPKLTNLLLGANQIGAEGAARLAGVLPQCPQLCFLRLGGNQIGGGVAERPSILALYLT